MRGGKLTQNIQFVYLVAKMHSGLKYSKDIHEYLMHVLSYLREVTRGNRNIVCKLWRNSIRSKKESKVGMDVVLEEVVIAEGVGILPASTRPCLARQVRIRPETGWLLFRGGPTL